MPPRSPGETLGHGRTNQGFASQPRGRDWPYQTKPGTRVGGRSVMRSGKTTTRPRRGMAPPNQSIPSSTTITLDDDRFARLVSPERLRATWRTIRREARRHRIRDVVDYLDWSRSIDECIPELSQSLLQGSYAPQPPARYDLAKAKGSFRVVTVPALRDAIVYRLLCDEALEIATPQKVPGAYFSRRHTAPLAGPSTSKTTPISSSSMCG
jgi:hypothetical protein